MERGTFYDIQSALATPPDDEHSLIVDASEYVEFNVGFGGYLSENDDVYLDSFRTYADCNYLEVHEAEEDSNMGWGILHCEAYRFAMPLDGEIDFEWQQL